MLFRSKIKTLLDNGENARNANLDENEAKLIKELGLMTLKPMLYIANCSEAQLAQMTKSEFQMTNEISKDKNIQWIPISAKIESELNELNDDEKKEYLKELGLESSGLDRLIKKAYEILGLISYLTSGEQETRAWTIKKGWSAPQAAGVIHGDFERGFIAADIVKYSDFVANNGWVGAKEKGLIKTQGKDYVMQDGNVVLFKFNV